jgi:hypothetical protein|tara:strand:+ start:2352 stop:2585 length:234 start_codon:yes stop_codon:yes gene_type:complete
MRNGKKAQVHLSRLFHHRSTAPDGETGLWVQYYESLIHTAPRLALRGKSYGYAGNRDATFFEFIIIRSAADSGGVEI